MTDILNQLEINSSIIVLFLVFLVFFTLMKTFYFSPFLQLFKLRQKATTDLLLEANRLEEEANQKLKEVQLAISKARKENSDALEQSILQIRNEESKILNEARDEAKQIVQKAMGQLDSKKNEISKQLEAELNEVSSQIVEKLVTSRGSSV